MSSSLCLNELLDKTRCDIALICEHKLLPYNTSFMDCLHSDYKSITCCDNNIDSYSTLRCGKGGVAIMYKNVLKTTIEILDIGSERLAGIKLRGISQKPYYIFATYLPANNNINHYRDYLDSLQEVYSCYSDNGHVIIAGDMNSSVMNKEHTNASKSREFKQFIDNYNIKIINSKPFCLGPSYTYLPKQTMLDYILTDELTASLVSSCEIFYEGSFASTSDNLPIVCTIQFQHKIIHEKLESAKWTAWHKAEQSQLKAYESFLFESLQNILAKEIHNVNDINQTENELAHNLLTAAEAILPAKRFSEHTKPYWDDNLKVLHRKECEERVAWLNAGRPRVPDNYLFRKYKATKDQFRKAQRLASDEFLNKSMEEIESAAECDLRLFWKLVKRKSKKRNKSCVKLKVNDIVLSKPDLVLKAFETYFSDL